MAARSQELEALCGEMERWRADSGGGRGRRIPRALWEQAIAVARVEGVYRTARATRLQGDRLKALMDEADVSSTQTTTGVSPQFVALQMPAPVTRTTIAIELHNHHGDRMRIEQASASEVSSILTAFLQRSS